MLGLVVLLDGFEGLVVGHARIVVALQDDDGVAVLHQDEVHHEACGAAVAVYEGVDADQAFVHFCGEEHRMHFFAGFAIPGEVVFHEFIQQPGLWRHVFAARDAHGHFAVASCVLGMDAFEDDAVQLEQQAFVEAYVLRDQLVEHIHGFGMVDGLEVFAHAFAGDGEAFVDDQLCFLQRERVAFDAVAVVGIGNFEVLAHFVQGERVERAFVYPLPVQGGDFPEQFLQVCRQVCGRPFLGADEVLYAGFCHAEHLERPGPIADQADDFFGHAQGQHVFGRQLVQLRQLAGLLFGGQSFAVLDFGEQGFVHARATGCFTQADAELFAAVAQPAVQLLFHGCQILSKNNDKSMKVFLFHQNSPQKKPQNR